MKSSKEKPKKAIIKYDILGGQKMYYLAIEDVLEDKRRTIEAVSGYYPSKEELLKSKAVKKK